MACWQLLDVSEERRVESPVGVEEKKVANREFVETTRNFGVEAERGDRVREDQT